MHIVLDGMIVAGHYWRIILLVLVLTLGFGGLLINTLPQAHRQDWLFFPLSLPLGVIALSLLSFALLLLARIFPDTLIVSSWLLFGLGAILFGFHLRRRSDLRSNALYLIAFSVLLITRLAFLKNMLMPPYSDSPEHYMIVQDFLAPNSAPASFYSIIGHYYHFGFHSFTAWMSILSGLGTPLLLALLGQVFLVITPFSVFALVGGITKDKTAAWIAFLLAGFGWQMPAFAVNWGKYPAVASIAVFPALLAVLYFLGHKQQKISKKIFLLGIVLVAGATFLHTRILICITVVILSHYLTLQLTDKLMAQNKITKMVLLAGSILFIFWFHWEIFFQGYYSNYFGILIGTALLLPFAFHFFPSLTLIAIIYLLGIGFTTELSAPTILQNYSSRLLDRTFVQTSLFLPLAILGSLGISGLAKALIDKKLLRQGVITSIILLLLLNATQLSYYPDPCCGYVRDQDIAAYNWINLNVPSDAVFFIPGLRVSDRLLGTDAGIWIQPLTGRKTKKRPFDISWLAPDVTADICQFESVYIYIGGGQFGFSLSKEIEISTRYQKVFSREDVSIYSINCSDH